jgi:hypothetical protein
MGLPSLFFQGLKVLFKDQFRLLSSPDGMVPKVQDQLKVRNHGNLTLDSHAGPHRGLVAGSKEMEVALGIR